MFDRVVVSEKTDSVSSQGTAPVGCFKSVLILTAIFVVAVCIRHGFGGVVDGAQPVRVGAAVHDGGRVLSSN